MRLFDAHVHLADDAYVEYLDHLLTGLRAMNIVACSVTVDIATAQKSIELFRPYRDVVKIFVGIHPEAAGKEDLEVFKRLFSSNLENIDGVGEIGLDKTYDERGIASYSEQKKVFEAMLLLAESSGKPVSVHSRKSLDDILEMLPSYNLKNVLLHWFAGSKKQLGKAAEMGLYISFGPVLVYSEDKKVLLRIAARDRILIETDGPVSYPRCFENLPASPTSFLVSVVASAAKVLGLYYEEAGSLFESNSLEYLS